LEEKYVHAGKNAPPSLSDYDYDKTEFRLAKKTENSAFRPAVVGMEIARPANGAHGDNGKLAVDTKAAFERKTVEDYVANDFKVGGNMSMPNDNGAGKENSGMTRDYKMGSLPALAPLAAGYVPWQRETPPQYDPDDALTRGTLFPGLDLPFMNVANKGNPYAGTPLGDLMAIGFVANELMLYLDTHPRDGEAFAMLKKVLMLKKEAHERYVARFGSVRMDDLARAESYDWVRAPFPWEVD
jgi:spore coat protein JB